MALGKFQMLEVKDWKGLTKSNHLGTIFRTKPQKATEYMVQLLAQHRGKSLETYLRQFPVKTFQTDDEFYWEIIGSSNRNYELVEARYQGSVVTASDFNIGAGGSVIELVFAEDMIADGNRIVGEKNEVYPLRILDEGRPEGSFTVYKAELMGGVTDGMPGEELVSGTRWSVDYSPVEDTMSREVGDVRYSSPTSMRNEWTHIRIKTKAPGNMLNRQLATGLPYVDKDGNKKVATTWMHHVDFKVEETFSKEKSTAIMFSRSNRLSNGEYQNIGKSGNVIREGDGIRAQMEVANTIFYDEFSLSQVEDILFDLSESKLGFGDRMFVMRTGERGAKLFHQAALDTASGWQSFNYFGGGNNPAVIAKSGSALHDNALTAGFQFVEFRFANNIVVRVETDPFYDDRERNKVEHPDGGVAESYRFDILYIGTRDMEEPNIQLCKLANNDEYRGYQWGPFRNPFTGEMGNPSASFDEDAAVIHKYATLGAVIYDPSRTASLIPNVLA